MKKWLFSVTAVLLMTGQTFADYCGYPDWCTSCCGFDSVFTVGVGGGYRNDQLKWKRFPKALPGIEVEEKWKNIGMGVVDANAAFLACDHYLFKVDFNYGWFDCSGRQTFDVFDNNVLIQSLNSKTTGRVYDISGAIGYQFNFECYRFSLAPLVGYSYNYQRFKNKSYHDNLYNPDAEFGFRNTYKFRWSGPWAGFGFAYQPCCDWLLFFDYAFHWANFRGSLDEQFPFVGRLKGARIRSNGGHGNEFTVGGTYLFSDCWWLSLKFNYKEFCGSGGRYRTDNDIDDSSLRKLSWRSYIIALNIGYSF